MQADPAMQRVLKSIAAALNDGGLEDFDAERVQLIAATAVSGERTLTVDDGGGLHDETGVRVGAIRRAPSGEWIIDGQNTAAARSDAPIPAAAHTQDEPAGDDDEQR
jgi:hypothetical protein